MRFGAVLIMVSSLALSGCGEPVEGRTHAASGHEKEAAAPCFSIVNGQKITSYLSVGYLGSLRGQELASCTGTFVGHNVMLTAAHCLDVNNLTNIYFLPGASHKFSQVKDLRSALAGGKRAKRVIHAESKDLLQAISLTPSQSTRDLAFLIFEDQVAPAISPILDRQVEDNEAAILIGFGANSSTATKMNGVAQKRLGRNRVVYRAPVKEKYPNVILTFGRAESGSALQSDATIGFGDSGGPLLIQGAVAGVASTGGRATFAPPLGIEAEAQAFHAKTYSDFARKLIKMAREAGADIQLASEYSEQNPDASGDQGAGDATKAGDPEVSTSEEAGITECPAA